ncbi:hypothetical protein GCM10010252_22500 [Streptomyces aureoverticillatus]|nr:hypothetical protein GCM10010252_22500 [Streptomyces aureoverticillatus]
MVSHDHEPERVPPPQPVHRPVPGNPYAQPEPAVRTGGTARTRALGVGAAVLALALVGGGVFLATRGDGDGEGGGSREPAAAPSNSSQGPESSTGGGGQETAGPGADDDRESRGIDVNAGRKPGEARAWLGFDDVKLPGKGTILYDLWREGDIVAQATYDEVTAFKSADGTKAWSVRLPGAVCDTPVNASPDGKVVVVYTTSKAKQSVKCDQLQMIDLKTGKKGWHKKLVEHDLSDGTTMTHVAISGSTVMVDQDSTAHAYRVRDGKRLFSTKPQREGACFLKGVAGGSKLLQVQGCAAMTPTQHGRLRKLDPRTGKVEWTYRSKKGWSIDKVYSVDPVVVSLRKRNDYDNWAVAAVDEQGRQRSWIELGGGKTEFEQCAGAGDSGEGVQNCPGGVVEGDTLYLASKPKDTLGPNKLVAFDLAGGNVKWSESWGGRQLQPVPVSGKGRPGVIAYARPSGEKNGRVLRFGPRGGKPDVLLRHTSAARKTETFMFAGHTLYADGRFYVTSPRLDGRAHGSEGDEGKGRMLSYGR